MRALGRRSSEAGEGLRCVGLSADARHEPEALRLRWRQVFLVGHHDLGSVARARAQAPRLDLLDSADGGDRATRARLVSPAEASAPASAPGAERRRTANLLSRAVAAR